MSGQFDETVQWSYDFIHSFYLNNSEVLTESEKLYLHYLSPFADKYFSPVNAFTLFGGADIAQLLKKDTWLIRDGLIPLSFFFHEASQDLMSSNRRFIIHRDFWFLVPAQWRKSVLFYQVKAKNEFHSKNLPEKIFIAGIANDTMADQDEFVQSVKDLSKLFSKQELTNIEVQAFFPNKRTDLWGKWQDENIFKYARELFENIKIDIEFPEWELIKSHSTMKNTLYWEVNGGALIKDTSVSHLMLSKGAGLWRDQTSNPLFKIIQQHPLSLYHTLEILSFDFSQAPDYADPLKSEMMPYFKKIIERGTSPRVISAGWEKWFGSYVKKHYKARTIY